MSQEARHFADRVFICEDRIRIYGRHRIMVIRFWPNLMAWNRTRQRKPAWKAFRPLVDLKHRTITHRNRWWEPHDRPNEDDPSAPDGQLLLRIEEGGWNGLHAFFDCIPFDVECAIWDFPSRHWHLLHLAARCPGGLDLIRSNPALAWPTKRNPAGSNSRARSTAFGTSCSSGTFSARVIFTVS